MKRREVIDLYSVLKELKSASISKEGLVELILMRVKLRKIFDEFEKTRVDISEQTKPENFKDGDNPKNWEKAFKPVMDKWLEEDIEEIDTKVLTPIDFSEIVIINDLIGSVQDYLFIKIVKE